MTDTGDSRLGQLVARLSQAHPGRSGIFPLTDGRDAFAARSLLADVAERCIDVQYYIWRNDMAGTLLFDALRRAAARGVRVRLLLDDNNTVGLDALLATLNEHSRIEVRLFNPFMHRRWRALGYLIDFARLNRRMHNKSFTVDNQATIIGGRNVGNEYFDATGSVAFVDLDVMAIGPVVSEVSHDFDRYWASHSAYPVERVLPPVDAQTRSEAAAATSRIRQDQAASAFAEALRTTPLAQDLLDGRLNFEWAVARMVSDDPAKGLARAAKKRQLLQRLQETIGLPRREVQLISPYFVPTVQGVRTLAELSRQGVDISILTNALEATDVAAVHAGYAKHRKALLEEGIALFEMRRRTAAHRLKDRGLTGNSGSSLHAKTFSVDRTHVFVGSFNFDPRSARLNTENGFVIDSPSLAQALAQLFTGGLHANAYEVQLSDTGSLQWRERNGDRQIVHDREPGTTFWRHAAVTVTSWLPVEWLL